MANIRNAAETADIRSRVLLAATQLFLEKGYERTTVLDISTLSGVPKNTIFYEMKSKEDILGALVTKFLGAVTEASNAIAEKLTDDRVLIVVANEVLQLYMAEMSEDMRNLYLAAYSLPVTSAAVLRRRAEIMVNEFSDMFPDMQAKDFYEMEIASMGIMRAYMTVPCDLYFTHAAKAKRLVSTLMRIYNIQEEKINETQAFIDGIDFESAAERMVESVFKELAIKHKK